MFELKFKDDKKALKKLAKAQRAVDKYAKKHSKSMSDRQHKKFRKLLNKKTKALRNATGMNVRSIFE